MFTSCDYIQSKECVHLLYNRDKYNICMQPALAIGGLALHFAVLV